MTLVSVSAGAKVILQGTIGDAFYVVLTGEHDYFHNG
jgi:CRP-like cAMP-binding protein